MLTRSLPRRGPAARRIGGDQSCDRLFAYPMRVPPARRDHLRWASAVARGKRVSPLVSAMRPTRRASRRRIRPTRRRASSHPCQLAIARGHLPPQRRTPVPATGPNHGKGEAPARTDAAMTTGGEDGTLRRYRTCRCRRSRARSPAPPRGRRPLRAARHDRATRGIGFEGRRHGQLAVPRARRAVGVDPSP